MNMDFESLISYENLISNTEEVLKKVEEKGKVVILKDNNPVYVLGKLEDVNFLGKERENKKVARITLHKAMKIVLEEKENRTMHAAELADEIYKRDLYYKKDGTKARYNQVRARCGHYPDMFETLPGNMIRLKDDFME